MLNEEKSEENILIFDTYSEIEDSTIKYQKNEIDSNANEENMLKKNEIFFLVYNKFEISENELLDENETIYLSAGQLIVKNNKKI